MKEKFVQIISNFMNQDNPHYSNIFKPNEIVKNGISNNFLD